jgi:predicted GIY-YIG superfamily endonuclease
MAKKRDTFLYELKDGNTIVYYGISNGPADRTEEHERSRKNLLICE